MRVFKILEQIDNNYTLKYCSENLDDCIVNFNNLRKFNKKILLYDKDDNIIRYNNPIYYSEKYYDYHRVKKYYYILSLYTFMIPLIFYYCFYKFYF